MACWSNMAPCGMMSERLAEILGLETLPLRNGRKRLWSPISGSSFGGEREQWHFVRELEVSFEAKSLESGNAQMQTLTLGPLLVVPSPVSPLVLGQDLHRAVGGSGLCRANGHLKGLESQPKGSHSTASRGLIPTIQQSRFMEAAAGCGVLRPSTKHVQSAAFASPSS